MQPTFKQVGNATLVFRGETQLGTIGEVRHIGSMDPTATPDTIVFRSVVPAIDMTKPEWDAVHERLPVYFRDRDGSLLFVQPPKVRQ